MPTRIRYYNVTLRDDDGQPLVFRLVNANTRKTAVARARFLARNRETPRVGELELLAIEHVPNQGGRHA